MLQDVLAKKVTPSRRRPVVSYWHDTYRVSERCACRDIGLDLPLCEHAGAEDCVAAADSGDRSNSGSLGLPEKVGKKLVYRLYREEGLALRHKPRRKRRAEMHRRERFRPTAPNQVWSLDFVADQLADGRRFQALTVLDIFTRESLAIEVGQRLKGEDVVGALNQIRQKRGTPKLLFCDNGSEFTSQMMDRWA